MSRPDIVDPDQEVRNFQRELDTYMRRYRMALDAGSGGVSQRFPIMYTNQNHSRPPPPPNEENWDVVSQASTERLGGDEDDAGGVQDEREGRLVIPLVQNLEKIVAPDVYREMIARSQNLPQAVDVNEREGVISIQFKDFQLNGLDEAEGNVRVGTQKESLLTLKSYLIGKKKGKDKLKCPFSLYPGQTNESRTRFYFLKVDNNLLEKLSRTLKDASISASLKVVGPSSPTNSPGPSNSSASQRHHPYMGFLTGEQNMETRFKTDGMTGIRVADLLRSNAPGVVRLRAADMLFNAAGVRRIRIGRQAPSGNSDAESVRFALTVNINCANGPKLREKVKVGSDEILQAVYNLDDESKDVTIVASNGAEIKCHRNILMAQSTTLRSMLSRQQGMAEARTGRIELNENSEDGLREFIRYLYGFEVPVEGITSDMAVELFQLGNKYQVRKLEDSMKYFLCEKKMHFYTVDSILEMYFTARNVDSLEELRAHALTEMSTLSEDTLKSSDYFRRLCQEDQVDLLFKLLEWNK